MRRERERKEKKKKKKKLALGFDAHSNNKNSDAQLIMRGARSLGYGFVEMASEADAQAVVRAMHKKTVDNREINVEIAKSRVTDAELAERAAKPRRRVRGPRRDGDAPADGTGAPQGDRPPRQPRADGGAAGARGGNNGGVNGGARQGGDRAPQGDRAQAGGRPPRQPRADGAVRQERAPRTPDAERPLSETTVFVANLPFSTTNGELLDFFKPAKAVDAVVSCRPSGRSKGFGFVKFNKADLANAVASTDGKQLGDRKVTVRVAMTEFDTEKARNESIHAQVAAEGKDGVPQKRGGAQE